jgi:hypothetical protein
MDPAFRRVWRTQPASTARRDFVHCGSAITWGERWDSNPRSPGPQPGALTAGLRSPPVCIIAKKEAGCNLLETGNELELPLRDGTLAPQSLNLLKSISQCA